MAAHEKVRLTEVVRDVTALVGVEGEVEFLDDAHAHYVCRPARQPIGRATCRPRSIRLCQYTGNMVALSTFRRCFALLEYLGQVKTLHPVQRFAVLVDGVDVQLSL